MPQYWKVYCMEDRYPGLWHTWFRNQIACVGWPPGGGWSYVGDGVDSGWARARNCLKEIKAGDMVVVQLMHHRVGRIGEVIRKDVQDDQWLPTVPKSKEEPFGEQGRRIVVRWDLLNAPPQADAVVELPKDARLSQGYLRSTICRIPESVFQGVFDAMRDQVNWSSLVPGFAYERSLSDYIVAYPERLEDGLRPYPSEKAREYVFGDQTRLDVLLLDRDDNIVIVECKQHAPAVENLRQLRGYMEKADKLTHGKKKVRGILVHGGARNLPPEVRKESQAPPRLQLLQYRVEVGFSPSV